MVYIILGTGFEEMEAVAPYDILKRGGVQVQFAAIGEKTVTGGHGISVTAETTVEEIDFAAAELIVVPGGLGGVDSIMKSSAAMSAVKKMYDEGKKVAAICAGPCILSELGILEGKTAVCYPGMEGEMKGASMTQESSTVVCKNVITGRGPGASLDFGLRLLSELRGDEAALKVASAMHYERR